MREIVCNVFNRLKVVSALIFAFNEIGIQPFDRYIYKHFHTNGLFPNEMADSFFRKQIPHSSQLYNIELSRFIECKSTAMKVKG